MDLNLTGRTALITGGSKGIGLSIAEEFAKEGFGHLHLAARGEEALDKASGELAERYGVQVTTHPGDLADDGFRHALAQRCAGVDVLVNNAGAIPGGTLDDIDMQRWRESWELKVFGYITMTRLIYDAMVARGAGVIINIVGTGGTRPNPGYICGAPANAALIMFTESLGGESVMKGVRVCGVNPGPVDTERWRWLLSLREAKLTEPLDEFRAKYLSRLTYGRAARPDEISGLVAFLASDRASYISGTMMNIDGGLGSRQAGL